jgi:predicted MPP superfamily phosphohydrolase
LSSWAPAASIGVLIAVGLLCGTYALLRAFRVLRLTRLPVGIQALPPALNGYRIGVLSDLHHGPHTGVRHLERAIRVITASRPDIVVLLGDYGTSHWIARWASRRAYRYTFARLTSCLRELHAPDGVVAILGNHDHLGGAPDVVRWLRACGIRVLVNEHLVVRRGTGELVFAGVDDVEEGQVDPAGGCAGARASTPQVILSHNPDGVHVLAPGTRADLVLSGHTHGGQIVLPLLGAAVRNCTTCGRHTAYGWVPNPRALLYVSSGVGVQIPARIGTTGEVVLVTLHDRQQPA